MSSSWADDTEEEVKPPPPAWGGWKKPAQTVPAKDDANFPSDPKVKAKAPSSDDFPTLGGGGGKKSDRQQEPKGDRNERNGNDHYGSDRQSRDSYNDRPPRDGRDRDTYSAPRGDYERSDDRRGSYDRPRENYGGRDSYNDRPPREDRRDSYSDRPRGGGGDYGGDRRDSYGGDRRDSYGGDRRDSYGGDRRDSTSERRDYGGERRDSYNDRPRGGGDYGGDRRDSYGGGRDYDGHDRRDSYDRPERRERPPRAKIPLPTSPPYIAYVGNLSFEALERDIEDFFECECEVRIVTFPENNRPRGFAYVTFKELAQLEAALQKDGQDLMGRGVRVDVSEGKKEKDGWGEGRRDRGGFGDRKDRDRGDRKERDNFEDRDAERELPQERKPLNLVPRSLPSPLPLNNDHASEGGVKSPGSSHSDEAKSPSGPKSNPFGAAKPRDEKEWLRKQEERQREREEKERVEKERAEKERAEKDKAVRAPSDDRRDSRDASAPRRDDNKRWDDRKPGEGRPASGPRRDDRDNRDFPRRDDRDNRDSRGSRDFGRPRDDRDNKRDDRDKREDRPRPSAPSQQGGKPAAAQPSKSSPPAKETKKEEPKKAQPPKQEKKKKEPEIANQFAVLDLTNEECP